MKQLATEIKNNVLLSLSRIILEKKKELIRANELDLAFFDTSDRAMYDRLVVDDRKVLEMSSSILKIYEMHDPVGRVLSEFIHENGMQIINRTCPFGTVLIIYESRPDVTVEASIVAFKAGNRIVLKGGKESLNSNLFLVGCWHLALQENHLDTQWVKYLQLNREETQNYISHPPIKIDVIIPRGGESLIEFVKKYATCPVIVSGRGNNFLYVHEDADWGMALQIILNAKLSKISACNALDKILIHVNKKNLVQDLSILIARLKESGVQIFLDHALHDKFPEMDKIQSSSIWEEEFLALKICIGLIGSMEDGVEFINRYSGGHSVSIVTSNTKLASVFMENIDAAAVYHNASTRFTDGGQMGGGAEMAISTDKLHHRGPLGLEQMCSNKYYVYGEGQIRH